MTERGAPTTMVVMGSDRFTSRPRPRAELLASIDPKLRLHTVNDAKLDELDPLTYEVVRHRIWAITDEMGETLRRMSGSHVVTEANDFNFTICDEVGDQVQVGLFNTGLVGSMDLAIFWTLEHRSGNPGIEPGDLFLCNDPWIGGGLHQSDAAVLAPIFHDGELFAWSTAICHQVDLGGPSPGGYSPTAMDVFSEAVPTPPIKVVRGGVLQDDVADAWVRRSRVPLLVGLDLRAQVAANHTAGERIAALVERHGRDTVKAVMKRMMRDSETRLRRKLESLPDGTWEAVGYQDQSHQGDRGVHKLALKMTKAGDQLTFDFRGTDPQTGMINCPYPGLRAGVMFTLLPILGGDSPWSPGGMARCLDIISDEGTINNARFPAAVGKGPVGPAWATGNLVAECLARMLDSRVATRDDVQSVCAGTYDACRVSGLDGRSGSPRPFVAGMFDAMAAGLGAQREHDGVDTGVVLIIPQGRAPDAEMTEYLYPLLMVWRREESDSGGPGRRRGGVSGSICLIPHKNLGPVGVTVSGGGKAVSQAHGLAGGYPGCSQVDIVFRDSATRALFANGRIPRWIEELGERRDIIPAQGQTVLHRDDTFFMHWQSGGGYGDPLLREAQDVGADVRAGHVTVPAAAAVYGVVVDASGTVDDAGTAALRAQQRRGRLARSRMPTTLGPRLDPRLLSANLTHPVDDNLAIVDLGDGRAVACVHCGQQLGRVGDDIGAALAQYEGPVADAGPHVWPDAATYVDTTIAFRQWCCPTCAVAIHTRVAPVDHPGWRLQGIDVARAS